MWRRGSAKETSAEELAQARAQLALLEDEVLRLRLSSQRESESASAFAKLRQLPGALPTTEDGDVAWQALAEAIWTRDILVQACSELASAVDEIKERLLDMPALDSVGRLAVHMGSTPDLEELCPKCGKGPFKRLSSHLKVHENGNGQSANGDSSPSDPFEARLRRDMARD